MKKCWCGNEELREYSIDYNVCNSCKTLVTKEEIISSITSVADEENDLYGINYWESKMLSLSKESDTNALIQSYLKGRVPYWTHYILKYIPLNHKIAEIGGGLGSLSYFLKFIGYRGDIYELSPSICHFLENEMGLNVICGELGSRDESYDSILAFDLFEHLLEPSEFLQECKNKLFTEKGVLCLQTPCYNPDWSYEEMLVSFPAFKDLLLPKEHIFIYSKESIQKFLKLHGFGSIYFEKPAFGENYDMFLFASEQPIEIIDNERIGTELRKQNNWRIAEIVLEFFERLNGQFK